MSSCEQLIFTIPIDIKKQANLFIIQDTKAKDTTNLYIKKSMSQIQKD